MQSSTGISIRRAAPRLCCVALSLAAASFAAQANEYRYKVLRSFASEDGQIPQYGELVEGPDGHLYGTTYYSSGSQGFGLVYRLSPSGELNVLHEFVDDGIDGTHPQGGVSLGSDGYLYGATPTGGGITDSGTLYRVSPAGAYEIVHAFDVADPGRHPVGPPVQAADGNFYGLTVWGGESACGTIYKLTPGGELTHLRALETSEACSPVARFTVGSDGHLYGTAQAGGASGLGSVFRFTLAGDWKTLHSFDSSGFVPYAPVTEASNGRFYGTTSTGGADGMGTVFSVTRSGKFKTLHTFAGGAFDGGNPQSGLVQTPDGDLYGTTRVGGTVNRGTIYRMSISGKLRIEHHFGEKAGDGSRPFAGLTVSRDGSLYGTTSLGGSNGIGAVFRMKPKP